MSGRRLLRWMGMVIGWGVMLAAAGVGFALEMQESEEGTALAPQVVTVPVVRSVAPIVNVDEPVGVRRYASCAAMRRDHPEGVLESHPDYRPALDPDEDGTACEVE